MSASSRNMVNQCPRCREPAAAESAPGYCLTHHQAWQHERRAAVAWSRWALVTRNVCILDTETTGLGADAEVVELAVLSTRGEVLCESLVRPRKPIPPAATAVHHLDNAAVADAPLFVDMYGRLTAVLRKRFVIVYNAAYDRRILDQTGAGYNLPSLRPAAWHCAMLQYARYTGVWNRDKGDYKWHKLQSGDHTALGDCRATLETIRWMAEQHGYIDRGSLSVDRSMTLQGVCGIRVLRQPVRRPYSGYRKPHHMLFRFRCTRRTTISSVQEAVIQGQVHATKTAS